MSAIDETLADKIFEGIDYVRAGLPQAAALAELIDPRDAALIAGLELGLSKLFGLVVALRGSVNLETAAETLRQQTLDEWKAANK